MRARVVLVVGVALALALSAGALGAKSKPKPKPKLANVVYIRFQLSETFQRDSPSTGSQELTATSDIVQAIAPADLKRDHIIHALRVVSSTFTAELPAGGSGTCSYTGALEKHGAPVIRLEHGAHQRIYGMVVWPAQNEGSYQQTPSNLNSSNCPPSALLTPLEGPSVSSSPGVGSFTVMQRFDNAIFPVAVPKGQRRIRVKMSSLGNVPGETDRTSATGWITISHGRCPSGLKKCKPTNGKP
jgi:hypothetical protein